MYIYTLRTYLYQPQKAQVKTCFSLYVRTVYVLRGVNYAVNAHSPCRSFANSQHPLLWQATRILLRVSSPDFFTPRTQGPEVLLLGISHSPSSLPSHYGTYERTYSVHLWKTRVHTSLACGIQGPLNPGPLGPRASVIALSRSVPSIVYLFIAVGSSWVSTCRQLFRMHVTGTRCPRTHELLSCETGGSPPLHPLPSPIKRRGKYCRRSCRRELNFD